MKIRIFVQHMAIVLSSGLLFVNLYNAIVDAPNWGHQLSYADLDCPGNFIRN